MAGRLAPFIELGVGFNQDLSARENVILNAVMMGLTPKEARKRLDAVFEFAELDEFREMKLKNYSSGMSVRLAFAVMLQADADILLIDEVLAVGDAAFQQKCTDVFHDMRDSGKTVILVTHDMSAVQTYCHRAMLLHDGELIEVAEPEDVGRHYLRLNFSDVGSAPKPDEIVPAAPALHARLVEAHLVDAEGNEISNVEQRQPIRFEGVIEAIQPLIEPTLSFHCHNAEGVEVFTVHQPLEDAEGRPGRVEGGGRIKVSGEIENPLANGRHVISCWITSHRETGEITVQELAFVDFAVFGPKLIVGAIDIEATVEATAMDEEEL
jgi:ABC-2 type transport system ATP-binding protein